MNDMEEAPGPVKRAGKAVVWRTVQLVAVKAIFMLRLVVLAWLLTPDDFGLVAIATTAVGFLLQLTEFGMIPALIQGREVDEAHYNVAWTVGVTRATGVCLVVFFLAPWMAQLFSEPRATPIIQVLALRPILDSVASIKVARLTRELDFRPLAILKLSEAIVSFIVAVLLAPAWGVWALVAGILAGSTTYLVLSYVVTSYRPRFSFAWETIRPLIRFGRWVFLTGLIVLAGNYVHRIVISRQLGTADLGLYFLAAQLAFLPAEAASEVVGAVVFPLFSRLQSDARRAAETFRMAFTGLAIPVYLACALLITLAPSLIENVLGPKWEGTAAVIQILALVSMIGIFGEVAVPLFNGFGLPNRVTAIEVVQSASIILFVLLLTGRFGLSGAALAWLPTAVISQIVSIAFLRDLLPQPLTGLGRPFLVLLAATAVSGVIALATVTAFPGLAGLLLAAALAGLAYGLVIWTSDRRFGLGFFEILKRLFPQLTALIGARRPVA